MALIAWTSLSFFPCGGIILGINIFYFPPFLSKTGLHHCHFPKITDSHVVRLIVSYVPIIFFYIVCTIIFPWKWCLQTEHPTDPPSFLCQSSLWQSHPSNDVSPSLHWSSPLLHKLLPFVVPFVLFIINTLLILYFWNVWPQLLSWFKKLICSAVFEVSWA